MTDIQSRLLKLVWTCIQLNGGYQYHYAKFERVPFILCLTLLKDCLYKNMQLCLADAPVPLKIRSRLWKLVWKCYTYTAHWGLSSGKVWKTFNFIVSEKKPTLKFLPWTVRQSRGRLYTHNYMDSRDSSCQSINKLNTSNFNHKGAVSDCLFKKQKNQWTISFSPKI